MGVKETPQDRKRVRADLQNPQWDRRATVNYGVGTAVQIGALTALLAAMDWVFPRLPLDQGPTWWIPTIACGFFAFITLRSRLFSPLDNTRTGKRYDAVKRPAWAPPPLAFPIIWMTIAVLRVVSSYWVWSASEQNFLAWPLVLFIVHLSLGDTWNTIFTVEGRLGAAVPVVLGGPLLSAVVVTWSYGQTIARAGWLLFPSCVWLAIASLLVMSIWRLNGREPLYPLVGQGGDR